MPKQAVRTLHDDVLNEIVPVDSRLFVDQIAIGAEKNYYSYNEAITTTSTGISGGGTRTGSYKVYDFGFAVTNFSTIPMRVQFHFTEIDNQGYTLHNWYTWDDVNAGEKRRFWAGFHVTKNLRFRYYILKEISIGPTPRGGKSEGAIWSAVTHPNISIYSMFNLKKDPVVTSESSFPWRVIAALITMVIGYMILYKIYHNN